MPFVPSLPAKFHALANEVLLATVLTDAWTLTNANPAALAASTLNVSTQKEDSTADAISDSSAILSLVVLLQKLPLKTIFVRIKSVARTPFAVTANVYVCGALKETTHTI